MDAQMQTEKVLTKKEKLCINIDQVIENDVSLPDYYGDIVKILGNSVTTNIFSATVTGDKAIIDGSVCVRVIYVDSSGKTDCFDTSCPFNRSVDVPDCADTDIISVTAVSDRVDSRAVNQRRAEIRGTVSFKVQINSLFDCEMITADEKNQFHFLPCKAEGFFLANSISKCFAVSSTEDITRELKIKKVYRCDLVPVVNEVRSIKNKLMIKGSVNADVTMLTQDGNFVAQRIIVPVNQIIDINEADEDSRCCVMLGVRSTDIRISPEAQQTDRKLEVALIVNADIDAYRKASINAVAEAYSPACELICKQNRIKCITDILRINENYTVTSKMDFSSCRCKSIADAAVRKIRYTTNAQNNSIQLKGNIHYGIVVITSDDEKLFFDRIADFEYTKQFGENINQCEFEPTISVNAINCSVNSSGEATVSTEIRIDGFVNIFKDCDVITSVETGKEKNPDNCDDVITVYFASKGERLWDIAKEHGSCVDFIKTANGIDEDVLSSDRMLVFELE